MSPSVAVTITVAVLALAVITGLLLRARDGRRRAGGSIRLQPADLAPAELAERATLVQFSTEMCARCPQVRRMLGDVAAAHPGVAHVEIDLTHRADLAARYRILQTPTTFLVDATGVVRSRWNGVPRHPDLQDAIASLHIPQETR